MAACGGRGSPSSGTRRQGLGEAGTVRMPGCYCRRSNPYRRRGQGNARPAARRWRQHRRWRAGQLGGASVRGSLTRALQLGCDRRRPCCRRGLHRGRDRRRALQLAIGAAPAVEATARVLALANGIYSDSGPTHAGIRHFDSGPTAAVRLDTGQTVVLCSQAQVAASPVQLTSLGLGLAEFRAVVAKGDALATCGLRPVCCGSDPGRYAGYNPSGRHEVRLQPPPPPAVSLRA